MSVRGRVRALALVSAVLLCACDKTTGLSLPGGHTPFPLITNRGGPTLSQMRLVVIVAANDDQRDSLFIFGDALLSSSWWQQASTAYGATAQRPAVHVLGDTLTGSNLPVTQLEDYTTRAIANSSAATPDARTLYLLYLPTGVSYSGNSSCQSLGFHRVFGTTPAGLAIVQRCRSLFKSVLEELTSIASHEIIEAATDPLGNGWSVAYPLVTPWTTTPWATLDDQSAEESGDFCLFTRYFEGGFYYQRVYSNAAVTAGGDPCIPKLAVPYYNLSTPQTWYTIGANSTIQIPVTGWSTDTTTDWLVNTSVTVTGAPLGVVAVIPTLTLTGATDSVATGTVYQYMENSGRLLTLHVTMPAGAPSGTWATIRLHSFRLDANGQRPPLGEDYSHYWYIGVYVPSG